MTAAIVAVFFLFRYIHILLPDFLMKVEIPLSAQKPVVAFIDSKIKQTQIFGIQRPNCIPSGHGSPCPASTFLLLRRRFLDRPHLQTSCPSVRCAIVAPRFSLRSLLYVVFWGAVAPFSSRLSQPCSRLSGVSVGLEPWTALCWCYMDSISCLLCSAVTCLKNRIAPNTTPTTIPPVAILFLSFVPTPLLFSLA